MARVHVRAWQVGYQKLLPRDFLDGLCAEERARRYDFANDDPCRPKTVVAIEAGVICGFATTAPARDADITEHGELCGLYVDPDWWGRRIGTALLADARERLVRLGSRKAVLWVLAGNTRAERFYRADQWSPDGMCRTECLWGLTVNEIRYQRTL